MDEIAQFKIIVEQLEICCDSLKEKSITKYRIALILLDNISEILLHRSCQQTFKRDDFIKWIIPQQYSVAGKKKIQRFFDEKIKVIEKERNIPKQIAEILSIGHKYRNAIYHRDTYNSATIGLIAKILFIAVCDLFNETQCGIEASVIGGYKKSFEWLSPYNIKKSHINFPEASEIISKILKNKIPVNLSSSIAIFCSDLENRVKNIQKLIKDELPWKTPGEINHILKWFEFQETHPHLEDELSAEYRKYIYKSSQKEPVDISPGKLEQIKESFQKEYHAKVDSYRQTISYSTINKIAKNKDGLKRAKNIGEALSKYFTLDDLLSRLECYIKLATAEWDRRVQMEIDLRRGK